MNTHGHCVWARIFVSVAMAVVGLAAPALLLRGGQTAPPANPEIPRTDTIQPDELVKEITIKGKPIIVCVAPRFLYDGAHIPGALFHGPGSTTEGLADLRHWAQGTARDRAIVLYCGCCPIPRCPNVRPALAELHEMGFTNLKVLWHPKDFHTDCMEKGYPVEK